MKTEICGNFKFDTSKPDFSINLETAAKRKKEILNLKKILHSLCKNPYKLGGLPPSLTYFRLGLINWVMKASKPPERSIRLHFRGAVLVYQTGSLRGSKFLTLPALYPPCSLQLSCTSSLPLQKYQYNLFIWLDIVTGNLFKYSLRSLSFKKEQLNLLFK